MSRAEEAAVPAPEPEWIAAGVAGFLAAMAGVGRWLAGRKVSREADERLERIERQVETLCRVLTFPDEDGHPRAISRKLADRLGERLASIETKLDKQAEQSAKRFERLERWWKEDHSP